MKFSKSIVLFIIFTLAISCTEKKKTEETSEKTSKRTEMNQGKERSQISRPVEEVIEIWVNSLGDRLKIDEQTKANIQSIYMEAYISSGGNLEENLNKDQAQLVRNQIVKDTKDEVVKLLNTDQQNIYLRFIKN